MRWVHCRPGIEPGTQASQAFANTTSNDEYTRDGLIEAYKRATNDAN